MTYDDYKLLRSIDDSLKLILAVLGLIFGAVVGIGWMLV